MQIRYNLHKLWEKTCYRYRFFYFTKCDLEVIEQVFSFGYYQRFLYRKDLQNYNSVRTNSMFLYKSVMWLLKIGNSE